jgi:hypothetical protein
MKAAWYLMLGGALLAGGCAPKSFLMPRQPVEATPPTVRRPARPTTLVTLEQVNDSNAREMSKRLLRELDRDEQNAVASAGESR